MEFTREAVHFAFPSLHWLTNLDYSMLLLDAFFVLFFLWKYTPPAYPKAREKTQEELEEEAAAHAELAIRARQEISQVTRNCHEKLVGATALMEQGALPGAKVHFIEGVKIVRHALASQPNFSDYKEQCDPYFEELRKMELDFEARLQRVDELLFAQKQKAPSYVPPQEL
eukprot:TRINITY_DN67210_c8_g4_i1.p1 TRINITY_DN67210_c8_g4~~TRINITY_DN67210_c8_g4_i1.p1  ORF type:complete len:170 (-),score=22.62 TRINITY_DN67210_c8_g4_i1:67-576(-)